MTRCAGSQGAGFACMQAPLDAARSVRAVVFDLGLRVRLPAA